DAVDPRLVAALAIHASPETTAFTVRFVGRGPQKSPLFPYTTLFRSSGNPSGWLVKDGAMIVPPDKTPHGGDIFTRGEFSDIQLRSEEHTSELQSPYELVCRLLLEKKNRAVGPDRDAPHRVLEFEYDT